jgi:RimJ/RimL family protein N-acetyltransferase
VNSSELVLRDVIPADLPTLYVYESDLAWCAMAQIKPRTKTQFDLAWKKVVQSRSGEGSAVVQKTILLSGHVCGTIGCRLVGDHWELGYGLGRAYWGRGIASCALGLFLSEVKLRPLSAKAAYSNVASICVLLKNGFVYQQTTTTPETERCYARDEVHLVLEYQTALV